MTEVEIAPKYVPDAPPGNGRLLAHIRGAAETIRYIDNSGLVPGSADETAQLAENAAHKVESLLRASEDVRAFLRRESIGLGDIRMFTRFEDALMKALYA